MTNTTPSKVALVTGASSCIGEAPDWQSRARHWKGETTDQLRTTTAELSARQRSTMDTSDKSFALDNHEGPIWGSRGREFKSRQPDITFADCHA